MLARSGCLRGFVRRGAGRGDSLSPSMVVASAARPLGRHVRPASRAARCRHGARWDLRDDTGRTTGAQRECAPRPPAACVHGAPSMGTRRLGAVPDLQRGAVPASSRSWAEREKCPFSAPGGGKPRSLRRRITARRCGLSVDCDQIPAGHARSRAAGCPTAPL